jgi:hypothetical protein
MWSILASDPTCDYQDLCESAYVMLTSLLEQRIGPANMITTMLYGDHIDYLFHSGRLDEAIAVCSKYQAKAEGSCRQHEWIAELEAMKTAIRDAQKDINGTIAAMDFEPPSTRGEALHLEDERRATLLLQHGNLQMQAGQSSSAALLYSQAVQILELSSSNGGDPRLLLTSLANLEAAQTRIGGDHAAGGTRAARMNLQATFDMETRAIVAEQTRARGSISLSSGPSTASEGRRASSGFGEGEETMSRSAETVGGGAWPATVSRPGISGSEAEWGWSPEVFVSPRVGMDDWRVPM